jgi:hypothetical protein
MARRAADIASVDMTTQYSGAASRDGTPDLGLGGREGMTGEVARAVTAQYLSQTGGARHGRLRRARVE